MISFTNLNEVAEAVRALPGKHEAVEAEALAHQNQLTKPPGALGRLEELAVFLASWQGQRQTVPDDRTGGCVCR